LHYAIGFKEKNKKSCILLLTNAKRYDILKIQKLHNATKGGGNMVNTNKIKGRMKELEITQADVAKTLDIAQPTANQKINNIRSFDLEEAEKLAKLLHIDSGEFGTYFFA
jgi:DNA-binding XRE family transcriptional regulator